MTDHQKQSIRELRGSGLGYKRISQDLELPVGTVKSFCRRENIMAAVPTAYKENQCRQCGKPLIQKSKRFARILIFTPFVAANGGGTEVPETPMLPCFMRFEYPRVILNTPVENLNTLTYEK